MIQDITDCGYYCSINPNIIKSKKGLPLIKSLSPDRILLKSDGPFSKLKNKLFTPDLIFEVYEEISNIHGVTLKNWPLIILRGY